MTINDRVILLAKRVAAEFKSIRTSLTTINNDISTLKSSGSGVAGRDGIDGNDGRDGTDGATGPAAWSAVAAWAASTAYVVGPPASVVTYSGETFVCTTAHTSTGVFDGTKWTKLAQKGSDGANGTNGADGPGYRATSTTSLATGAGSVAFTTQSGLAYTVGARVRATSAGTSEYMEGLVTAYSGTTLTVLMDAASGSGTHADWNINIAGDPSLVKRGVVMGLCDAYTPGSLGPDAGEMVVPYSSRDGTTVINFTVRAIILRVSTAGGAPSVTIEKSTGAGVFSAVTVGTVTLTPGAYEGRVTSALGTISSGDKLRMNIAAFGSAQGWFVTVILGET